MTTDNLHRDLPQIDYVVKSIQDGITSVVESVFADSRFDNIDLIRLGQSKRLMIVGYAPGDFVDATI